MATLAEPTPVALEQPDVSRADLWEANAWCPHFARLRAEAPVSYCPESFFGPYWSIARYDDIVAVEADPATFSLSWEHGGIVIFDMHDTGVQLRMFIAMDDPEHGEKRKTVAPAVTPSEIAKLTGPLRERTADILDSLPVGEEFDWVHSVSIPLTTAMGDMDEQRFIGAIALLLVGGHDTTRNSMSGLIEQINLFPEDWGKVKTDPAKLATTAATETIRLQTPIAHMRRTATRDVEFGGKTISKGDKVVMWYNSGNRDERVFPDAGHWRIRPARTHAAIYRSVMASTAASGRGWPNSSSPR